MEHLFSPCTRYQDIAASGGLNPPEALQELNLDVSTEEFLGSERAFTYRDLYRMLSDKNVAAWLTPFAAIARGGGSMARSWGQLDESQRRTLIVVVDGRSLFVFARSREHLLEICDILLRLLAASRVYSVLLDNVDSRHYDHGLLINAPTLAYVMEQCHSLKILSLKSLEMDEDQIRVLGAYSRPDLFIELSHFRLTDAGTSALAEVLGRNQGPTKVDFCGCDYLVVANGLRGNSRLTRFTPCVSDNHAVISIQELYAIASALKENEGLVELDLSYWVFSDETWNAVCDSLKTHPTLEVLDLSPGFGDTTLAAAVLKSRIQALFDMMKMNQLIHTIHLDSYHSGHALFRESVIPHLETNELRPRLLAIQKTRPILYRAKVLGLALLATRTNPNRFWMLLSGNAEVAFPSRTTTVAAVATLPTSITAAATVDVAPDTSAASTTSASNMVASAFASAFAFAAGYKRKS
jgi:hypothetical protein